ncbi:MAG: HK97 gp10 family phage protein [Thermoplasmata archaeon]|nr:MAG: HK97 gp10 family phage protein [Thermoplasmata archaeon]
MIVIKIKGLKELREAFKRAPLKTKDEINKAIAKSGFLVERESKKITPVDTGRLRASIRTDLMPMKAVIAPHTDYAIYVHENLRARHKPPGQAKYMEKGKQKAEPKIEDFFKQAINNVLNFIARKKYV